MNKAIQFVKESYEEMVHRVTWPSYSELQNSSVLVLVASLIFALGIWLVDVGFKNVLTLIYKSI